MQNKQIIMRELCCLDENTIFPECHVCERELSPFLIDQEELSLLNRETYNLIKKAGLLQGQTKDGKIIILICTKCVKGKRNETKSSY